MKNSILFKKTWLVVCGLVMCVGSANAVTWTAVQDGNWNTNATWGGSSNPAGGSTSDTYIIPEGRNVTITNTVNNYALIEIRGTLTLGTNGQINTSNSNGDNGGGGDIVATKYGSALTSYNIMLTRNGATLNAGTGKQCQPYNLTIKTQNADDVVYITGAQQSTNTGQRFQFGNNNNIAGTLAFEKGLLNINGQHLYTTKNFTIIVTAGTGTSPIYSGFATSIDGTCDHVDADAGTLWFEGDNGDDLYIAGTGNAVFNNINSTKTNWEWHNGNKTIVMGTFTRSATGNNNQIVKDGYFKWGPNSNRAGNLAPNGEYNNSDLSTAPPKINGATNTAYQIPTAIQDAIDGCNSCDTVIQDLDIVAPMAVCSGETAEIVVESPEAGVAYALYQGSSLISDSPTTNEERNIVFVTASLTTNSTFTVKTAESNDVYCKGKKIGNDIVINVTAATAISAHPQGVEVAQEVATPPLSVNAAGASLSYQWKRVVGAKDGDGNSETDDVTVGTNSSTFPLSTATIGTESYYVIVTGTCGSVTSNVAIVKVKDPTMIDEDAAYDCNGKSHTDNSTAYTIIRTPGGKYLVDTGNNNNGGNNNPPANTGYLRWVTYSNLETAKVALQTHWVVTTKTGTGNTNDRRVVSVNNRHISCQWDWGSWDGAGGNNWNTLQLVPETVTTDAWDYVRLAFQSGNTYKLISRRNGDDRYINTVLTRETNAVHTRDGGATNTSTNDWLFEFIDYPVASYPDIVINSITPDSYDVALGSPIAGTVQLTNTGAGAVASDTPIRIKISFNGQFFYFDYTGGLAASGGTADVPFTFTPAYETLSTGATLSMVANSRYAIDELDPCNNTGATDDQIVVSCKQILSTFTVKWTAGEIDIDCSKVGKITMSQPHSTGSLTQLETYFTLAPGYTGYTVWLENESVLTQLGLELDKQPIPQLSTYYNYGGFPFTGTVYVKDASAQVVEEYELKINDTRIGTGLGETPAAEIVSTEYYTLTGIKLSKPVPGVLIKKTLDTNGKTKVSKEIVK